MRDLAAIVLAAGGSTRLGTPKQLLKFQGKTLLRRVVDLALAAGCEPIVVVLGHQSDRMLEELSGLPIHSTLNPDWQRGMGSSIRQGITHLLELKPDTATTLLLLCDQPRIDADVLHRLMHAMENSGKRVCVCSFDHAIGPPLLVAAELFSELRALPDTQGAKAVWTSRPEIVELVPCPHAALDIDTPADLARLTPPPHNPEGGAA